MDTKTHSARHAGGTRVPSMQSRRGSWIEFRIWRAPEVVPHRARCSDVLTPGSAEKQLSRTVTTSTGTVGHGGSGTAKRVQGRA